MANSSPLQDNMDNLEPSAIHAELLQSVLDEEPSTPWIQAESADEYANRLEAAGEALELSDEAAAKGWQALSAQLNQMWEASTEMAAGTSVIAQLQQKFAERLPNRFLQLIADKAQQVVGSGQPMMDQLISCVRSELSNLGTDDLRVVARPMAFAMRGSSVEESVDMAINSTRIAEWDALAPIEQARLSLAAARYAIAQINES